MGQSVIITGNPIGDIDFAAVSLSVFPTDLGWFGLLGSENKLISLRIGHRSGDEVREAVRHDCCNGDGEMEFDESDWNGSLRRRLQRFALGLREDFSDVDIAQPAMTAFQSRILQATRRIGYGRTMSYAQLATHAGYPRAARAVGNVMASNRLPIIVPCHRIVAAGGRWGGFSAPQGVDLKIRMLSLEAAAAEESVDAVV